MQILPHKPQALIIWFFSLSSLEFIWDWSLFGQTATTLAIIWVPVFIWMFYVAVTEKPPTQALLE